MRRAAYRTSNVIELSYLLFYWLGRQSHDIDLHTVCDQSLSSAYQQLLTLLVTAFLWKRWDMMGRNRIIPYLS